MGHRALCGITRVRTSSVVALRDSARFASHSARKRLMPGSTPAVDTVTWRGESPGKTSVRPRTAAKTASGLSSGSPMPMKTTLRGGRSCFLGGGDEVLEHDLARAQVAADTEARGGAEVASPRAAGLRGHADGAASPPGNEDGLDRGVAEAERELDRAVPARRARDLAPRGVEGLRPEPGPRRLRHPAHPSRQRPRPPFGQEAAQGEGSRAALQRTFEIRHRRGEQVPASPRRGRDRAGEERRVGGTCRGGRATRHCTGRGQGSTGGR